MSHAWSAADAALPGPVHETMPDQMRFGSNGSSLGARAQSLRIDRSVGISVRSNRAHAGRLEARQRGMWVPLPRIESSRPWASFLLLLRLLLVLPIFVLLMTLCLTLLRILLLLHVKVLTFPTRTRATTLLELLSNVTPSGTSLRDWKYRSRETKLDAVMFLWFTHVVVLQKGLT